MEAFREFESSIAGEFTQSLSQFLQLPQSVPQVGGCINSFETISQNNEGQLGRDGEQLESQVFQNKRPRSCEKVSKPKKRQNVGKMRAATNVIDCSSDEEGLKRGPNWKDHWVVNLIHLQGTMHQKFAGMKKQGVDTWAQLHTQLVAICPDFDRSSESCRKKWKKIYEDYKSDYDLNGVSGNGRASKCKWYALVDTYMHERANVMKHVHESVTDDGGHSKAASMEGEQVQGNESPLPPRDSLKLVGKKSEKHATQDAIQELSQDSKLLLQTLQDSENKKLLLLEGMLATMNQLVHKF